MNLIRYISYLLLKRSISRHGYIAPVLVTRSGTILDGNRRVQACRELGILVPIVEIDAEIKMVNPYALEETCPVKIKGKKK